MRRPPRQLVEPFVRHGRDAEIPVGGECLDQARKACAAPSVSLAHEEARPGGELRRKTGELRLEHPYGFDTHLVAEVHEEQQHRAALHVPEEAQAEAAARGRPFDDARMSASTTSRSPCLSRPRFGERVVKGILGTLPGVVSTDRSVDFPALGFPTSRHRDHLELDPSSRVSPGTPFCANRAPWLTEVR